MDESTRTTFHRTDAPDDRGNVRTAETPGNGPAFTRVLLALAVVLMLIFVVRWLSRRVIPGQASQRISRAIHVVSRSAIAPRQQLMLVQVGNRLVLVANCGSTMTPLCEIDDADEVSQVLAQAQAEKSESISRAFSNLFRREEDKYAEPEAVAEPLDEADPPSQAVDRELDPDGPMATTRQELTELLDKVRGISKQFDK